MWCTRARRTTSQSYISTYRNQPGFGRPGWTEPRTCAFCIGDTLQHTTALQSLHIAMKASWLNGCKQRARAPPSMTIPTLVVPGNEFKRAFSALNSSCFALITCSIVKQHCPVQSAFVTQARLQAFQLRNVTFTLPFVTVTRITRANSVLQGAAFNCNIHICRAGYKQLHLSLHIPADWLLKVLCLACGLTRAFVHPHQAPYAGTLTAAAAVTCSPMQHHSEPLTLFVLSSS